METKDKINTNIIENFSRLKASLFVLPIGLLISIALFFYSQNALSADKYIEIQKDYFFFLNAKLSQFPRLAINLTQLGDALISVGFLSLLMLSAPKIWEALISGSLASAIFANILKDLFSVPRPAATFDHHTFVIIGRALPGHSSLPSGHAITIFTTLTVLMFAFMPKNLSKKMTWVCLMVTLGIVLMFTRVAIGAHYPLDVTVGGIIGYISGLIGIFISRKYKIWSWMGSRKYYTFVIVLLLTCGFFIITRILNENLIIYYLSFICLLISIYKITCVYVKK